MENIENITLISGLSADSFQIVAYLSIVFQARQFVWERLFGVKRL